MTPRTMNFETAKRLKAGLEQRVEAFGSILKSFPKGAMGLTTDAAKATLEYKDARRNYDIAFTNLRSFNSFYVRRFAAEARAERRARSGEAA